MSVLRLATEVAAAKQNRHAARYRYEQTRGAVIVDRRELQLRRQDWIEAMIAVVVAQSELARALDDEALVESEYLGHVKQLRVDAGQARVGALLMWSAVIAAGGIVAAVMMRFLAFVVALLFGMPAVGL